MTLVTPGSAPALRQRAGVVVHNTYWGDTAYDDWARCIGALKTLGANRVRDLATKDPNAGWQAEHEKRLGMLAAAGIHALFGFGSRAYLDVGLDGPLSTVKKFRAMTIGIEGPNELDISGRTNWPSDMRDWQTRLYQKVKGDPALKDLTVVGPSFGGGYDGARAGQPQGSSRDKAGDLSAVMDAGNLHPYTAGSTPNPTHLAREKAENAKVAGKKPFWATEVGQHDNLLTLGSCSQKAAAVYGPRTLLEHDSAGIQQSFLYELIDDKADPTGQESEWHFGLLNNDFSPKPVYRSLKNMLALCGGEGSPQLVPLDYSVSDGAVRHRLYRRTDGKWLLFLWRTNEVWNRDTKKDLTVAPVAVNVSIPAAKSVGINLPCEDGTIHPSGFSKGKLSTCIAGEPVALLIS